jgi:hypothetical protein
MKAGSLRGLWKKMKPGGAEISLRIAEKRGFGF